MNQRQRDRLAEDWQSRIRFDVPMTAYSTLRAGGRAAALIEVHTLDELRDLLVQLHTERIKFLIIGRGSNILIADNGYPGVVIRLKGKFCNIVDVSGQEGRGDDLETVSVRSGSGVSLAGLLSWCGRHELSGLEFMAGIPGSVGGAVRMNAGAWGDEIGGRLKEIRAVDCQGAVREIPVADLRLSYRQLALANGMINSMAIISATFSLRPDREETIRTRCREHIARRKGKQPAGVASAGSFFKNPPGDSAGRLIEAAGLKGVCCGQAMVSPVHANFIVNTGRATATEIITLMEQVQQVVFRHFTVRLEPEVRIFQETVSETFP